MARPRVLTLVAAWSLIATAGLPSAVLAVSPGSVGEARARFAAGDREGARELLDRLAAADTLEEAARTEALLLRAVVEENGTRYEERLRDLLDRGLRRDREAWAHFALGQIAYVRGDPALALREFRKARENGREEEGSLWEGLAAFALGDLDVARSALSRAQASENRSIRERALLARGDLDRLSDSWSDARAAYGEVREGGPGGPGWWATATLREAECLERLGSPEEADRLRADLLAAQPASYEAPLALARLESKTDAASSRTEPTSAAAGDRFAVQLGAFSEEANARALLEQLTRRGVKPVRIVRGDDGLSRVLAGAGLDRPAAESLGDSLGAALGVGVSLVREGAR